MRAVNKNALRARRVALFAGFGVISLRVQALSPRCSGVEKRADFSFNKDLFDIVA
jgi:hypothetical protein